MTWIGGESEEGKKSKRRQGSPVGWSARPLGRSIGTLTAVPNRETNPCFFRRELIASVLRAIALVLEQRPHHVSINEPPNIIRHPNDGERMPVVVRIRAHRMDLALGVIQLVQGKNVGIDGRGQAANVFKVDFVRNRHGAVRVGFGDKRRNNTHASAAFDPRGDCAVVEPSGIVDGGTETLSPPERVQLGVFSHPQLQFAILNRGVRRVKLGNPVHAIRVSVPIWRRCQLARIVKGLGVGDARIFGVASIGIRRRRIAARAAKEAARVAVALWGARQPQAEKESPGDRGVQ